MFSRATIWRRKRRLKENLGQMIASNNQSCDANQMYSLFTNMFNGIVEDDMSSTAQPSTFSTDNSSSNSYMYHSSVLNNKEQSDDESDLYVDQPWFEQSLNMADPWEKVELQPAFDYPAMEKQFLAISIDRVPNEREIAATLVLLKIRHRMSIKCIDHLCSLLKLLKASNSPMNYSRIKRLFLPRSSPLPSSLITYICPICCELSLSSKNCGNSKCTQHLRFDQNPIQYLQLPILPQLREILARSSALNFEQQRKSSSHVNMINDIYDGEIYQKIMKQENGNKFLTFLMNVDGVQVSKSSNASLWIFTLVINELQRSERFKLKNVIVAGVATALCKPSRLEMQALLSPIVKELLVLEQGEVFTVKGLNNNSPTCLKSFLIALCCDKPAQSLVQGVSEPIGAFGCGRCELEGVTVPIKPNSRKRIRVFPLVLEHKQQPRLRSNATYDAFMSIYEKEHFTNNVQLRDRLRGHVAPCVLRELKYVDMGHSFVSDSLHNIYHGVVKRLLHLWFDKKHRKQPWSIHSKIKLIDRYMRTVKYPSTTIRIPRSLVKYEDYKANEARATLLFGFSGFCIALPLKYARHLMLLVVAVHIAESRRIHSEQVEDIRMLLNRFLHLFPSLYTARHNTQSVHSLEHVAASVSDYGSLSNYSTFNFESILGLITSTVHSTRRHACEIHNNLRLLRLACIELDCVEFNSTLKQFVADVQSTKSSILLSTTNDNEAVRFRKEDSNDTSIAELQSLLRQHDIKLFKSCHVFGNRFTIMRYCSAGQKDDSCLLFLLGGKPCIGFIQNIIQIRRKELLLRICKVNVKDKLCLNLNNKKISCPNIFYGDYDTSNSGIFIKTESIIEKIIHVYNQQMKCYVFCRVPNLCESS